MKMNREALVMNYSHRKRKTCFTFLTFSQLGFILISFLYFNPIPSYAQNLDKFKSTSWIDQFENRGYKTRYTMSDPETWIDEFRLLESEGFNEINNSSTNNSDLLDYLILDLSDRRVYLYRHGQEKSSYPVAIGREGWETPQGEFIILNMERHPSWQNPWTGEVIAPGRDNPLGEAWIGFWQSGNNQIGFHGTPTPHLIGQAVSHGCVRMHNRDILMLFQQVYLGMTVWVKE